MSLLNKLENNVNGQFNKFIDAIVENYGLEKSDLLQLAKSFEPKKEEVKLDISSLSKKTVVELKALCKEHGHKVSGKKEELISRLLGEAVELPKTERKTKEKKSETKSTPLLQKIKETKEQLVVRKNKFGNFCHVETNLVMDKDGSVFGKQNEDSTVSELTDEDIESCKLFGLKYKLPKNLDKDTLEQEKVDELEDIENGEEEDEELEDDEDEELLDE